MKTIKTIIYLVLGLSSMSFSSETKYQKCYDITISADIKACMNDQQTESMKKSYDEKKAFIERGYNNVFQQEDFSRQVTNEYKYWKIYIKNKCQMEASTDTIIGSYAYWIEYFKCSSIEADRKAEYYKNYQFQ